MPRPPSELPSYGTFSAPTDLVDYEGGDQPPNEGDPLSCQVDGVAGPTIGGKTQFIIKQINGTDIPPDDGASADDGGEMTGDKLQELASQADSNMGGGPGAGGGY